MGKLLWMSDIHLNFVRDASFFNAEVKNSVDQYGISHVLVTGDIAESHNVIPYITDMECAIGIPVHFVLGNHDFYGSSIKKTRESVMHLNYLRRNTGTPISSTTILIGVDGWGDCRNGDYENSRLVMSDWLYIDELRIAHGKGSAKLKTALQKIADTDARLLACRVKKAITDGFKRIIIATHVPPYEGACLYAGRKSTPDGLCFFSSRILGECIEPIAKAHTDIDFLWLCGHTHSKVVLHVRENLEVRVAGSEYYYPTVAGVIDYE